MRSSTPLIAAVAAAALSACGNDGAAGGSASGSQPGNGNQPLQGTTINSGNGGPSTGGTTQIKLAVSLTPFPWDQSTGSADTSNLFVRVGDPAPLLTGAKSDANWIANAQVTAADCPAGGSCIVTFAGLETAGTTVGLWVQTVDSRGSYTGVGWAALTTAVPQATVNSLRTTAAGVSAAISTTDGTQQLATWSGIAKIDLIGNGAVIGLIGDPSGKGVDGAAVQVPDPTVGVVYANGAFTNHTQAPAASGTPTPWFVAAPSSAKVMTTETWTVGAGASSSHQWVVPKVGSAPNVLVFVPLFAGS